jgi:FHS family L-fucose permease-like MFS transporter
MPAPLTTAAVSAAPQTSPGASPRAVLSLLTSLFFTWGFITVINNTLLPHLRSVFDLNYTQTTLIESVWFIAYFFASIPSARLIERIGYQKSMVFGLGMMAVGALLMIPAARLPSYGVTLCALFVIACGITLLQVSANPYVAVLGSPETASSRLNLVQAFNSLGATLAPLFGAYLILGRSASGTAEAGHVLTQAEKLADAQAVQLPYLIVAGVLVILALVISRFPMPKMHHGATSRVSDTEREKLSLWKHRNLVFGIPAIFIYLIAEIGVANLFINFTGQPEIGGLSHEQGAHYLFLLWGGMLVGRFVGAWAIGAFVVMMIAALGTGSVAMWALISVGLFHSVMFPTIFTLGIKGLGPMTEEGAGLLIMAIAGGALVVVQGWLADTVGLQLSFLLTAACELYVLFYALWGSKATNAFPEAKVG